MYNGRAIKGESLFLIPIAAYVPPGQLQNIANTVLVR